MVQWDSRLTAHAPPWYRAPGFLGLPPLSGILPLLAHFAFLWLVGWADGTLPDEPESINSSPGLLSDEPDAWMGSWTWLTKRGEQRHQVSCLHWLFRLFNHAEPHLPWLFRLYKRGEPPGGRVVSFLRNESHA
jgi:hypothetical protein